jgi:uncharacterized damage-inducible protein DinB
MDDVLRSFVDMLDKLHGECEQTLQGLGTNQLDWRPGEGENSIAVLAAHIAGAEKFWVGDCVMGEPTNRDRPAEFATEGVTQEALANVLDGSLEYVRAALARLSDATLTEFRAHPRTGDQITVAWALNHAIQHTALHLGHMQVIRHWALSELQP